MTLAMLCCSTPVLAMPLPDCAGGVEIAHARVTRVEKNGALVLTDGRAVLLEGIRLPMAGERGPAALADDALAQLRQLAMAAPLTLTATRPKEDRYDRVRVQAFGDNWLQMEMLRRGLARVQIAPDRSECAPDFYEAEQAARAAGRGLWAFPAYGVRMSNNFTADQGSFQIVEGRVANADSRDGPVVLNFDSTRGFAAVIAKEDLRAFRDIDPSLEELVGKRIRVRGVIEDLGGRPGISLSNPFQIEILH